MNFTPQMMAVIQAIWTLRAKPNNGGKPGVQKLNHQEVEQIACDILKSQTDGDNKTLVVRRQSWYGSTAKDEWKAIRRSIDGEQPLSHHMAVETEIAKFDEVDGAGALKAEINELRQIITRQNNIIAGHAEEMDQFKAKAYFKQYIDLSDAYNIEAIERQHKDAQTKLGHEEDIRKKYQFENNGLRARVTELEKIAKAKGSIDKTGVQPIYKLFCPNLSKIVQSEPNIMLQDYAKLNDVEWNKLMQAATKQPPTDIYLIYHRFNVNIESFVAEKLPLVSGVVSYIFACYEPSSYKRERMFKDVARLIPTTPVVFLVEDSSSTKNNTVQRIDSKRDVPEQLHKHVVNLRRGFDYYDPITEGFAQVWIERV